MSLIDLKLNILKAVYSERDFSFLTLCLALFLLPLSINLSSFALIVSISSKLIQVFLIKQPFFSVSSLKYSSIIGLIFFLYIIISSLIQTDITYTVDSFAKHFSRQELLFLVPILFRRKKENCVLLYFFFSGIIISIVYVFIMTLIDDVSFDNVAFQQIIDLHHTYLCLFLLFFVNFLFIKYFQYKNENYTIGLICGILILLSFFMIFRLESKASIVIFSLLTLYHFFFSFSKRNFWGYLALIIAFAGSFYFFNQRLKVSYEHAMEFRLEIWNQSISLIEENPFFGSLKSSEKDLLNYKHYMSGKYYFMDSDLNSHNQYFSLLIKYGAFGVIILLSYGFLIFHTVSQ